MLHHAAVRTLVLTIFIFNITFGAAWSVLVLYATERLGLGAVGFGLLTTVSAVGGLVGTLSYGWITRRVSLGDIMRIGLVIETFTHLALALTTTPWVAMVHLLRVRRARVHLGHHLADRPPARRARPSSRAGSAASTWSASTAAWSIGSGIGGVLAQHWGVTAPFWFAFVGSALFVVLIWRQLTHIAHADEQPAPAPVTLPRLTPGTRVPRHG